MSESAKFVYRYPNPNQPPNPYQPPKIYPVTDPYAYPGQVLQTIQKVNIEAIPTVESDDRFGSPTLWFLLGTLILISLGACIAVPIIKAVKDSSNYSETTTTASTTSTTSVTTVTTTTTSTTATTTTSLCGATYSQSFTGGSSATSQCTVWNSFVSGLTCSSYSFLRLYGSNNPSGINITNPTIVTAVISALRAGTTYSASSNGYSWRVGTCGSGMELSATGSICSCSTGYIMRPCIGTGNSNWGGINSATCSASTQTMSLYVQ